MGLSNIASFADARLCSSEARNEVYCVVIGGVDTWCASGELYACCGNSSFVLLSMSLCDFLFSCKNERGGEYDDGVNGSKGEGRGEGFEFDHSEPVVGKSSLLPPSKSELFTYE